MELELIHEVQGSLQYWWDASNDFFQSLCHPRSGLSLSFLSMILPDNPPKCDAEKVTHLFQTWSWICRLQFIRQLADCSNENRWQLLPCTKRHTPGHTQGMSIYGNLNAKAEREKATRRYSPAKIHLRELIERAVHTGVRAIVLEVFVFPNYLKQWRLLKLE